MHCIARANTHKTQASLRKSLRLRALLTQPVPPRHVLKADSLTKPLKSLLNAISWNEYLLCRFRVPPSAQKLNFPIATLIRRSR